MELRPHLLTAAQMSGIRRLIGTTRFLPVGPFQCSTSGHIYRDASPKAVSERTSYSQIRLAFHSLPHVIRKHCTTYQFGPPTLFRGCSPCAWQAHLASGRMYPTNALLTLGFPTAPSRRDVANAGYTHSPAHSSIGTRQRLLDCSRTSATLCKYTVSVLFHSPLGVLFTFPSRYWFTIGHREYVALPVSSGRFARAIRVSSYSRKGAKE